MKVLVTWSPDPVPVYAIAFPRPDRGAISTATLFSVLDRECLVKEDEHSCRIVDGHISDFIFDEKLDPRYMRLVWAPLHEAGIWAPLWDHDPEAIEHFRQLRIQHGHIASALN